MSSQTNNQFFGSVQMIPPPITTLTFSPTKDAMLVQSQPMVNYGTSKSMQVCPGADGNYAAIFGFGGITIPDNIWQNLASVKLKLSVSGYDPYPNTVNLYSVSDNSWAEMGVSWSNVPAHSTTVIASDSLPSEASTFELDITNYIQSNIGQLLGQEFSVYLNAANTVSDYPLMVASRENPSGAPVLEISYYDNTQVPYQAAFPGSVNVIAYSSKDILGTLEVLNNYSKLDIDGSVTVTVNHITPVDIIGTLNVNYILPPVDIDGTLEIKLQSINPIDIDGSLQINIQPLIPVNINGTVDVVYMIPPVNINGTLEIQLQSLNPIDIDGSLTVRGYATPANINGSLQISLQPLIPVDIDGTISTIGYAAHDLPGWVAALAPIMPIDIQGSVDIIPAAYADVNGTITIQQTGKVDIEGNVIVLQKIDVFLAGEVDVILYASQDIDGEVSVLVPISTNINGNIIIVEAGGSYFYIM